MLDYQPHLNEGHLDAAILHAEITSSMAKRCSTTILPWFFHHSPNCPIVFQSFFHGCFMVFLWFSWFSNGFPMIFSEESLDSKASQALQQHARRTPRATGAGALRVQMAALCQLRARHGLAVGDFWRSKVGKIWGFWWMLWWIFVDFIRDLYGFYRIFVDFFIWIWIILYRFDGKSSEYIFSRLSPVHRFLLRVSLCDSHWASISTTSMLWQINPPAVPIILAVHWQESCGRSGKHRGIPIHLTIPRYSKHLFSKR